MTEKFGIISLRSIMKKLYFLWDYDWSEKKVRKVLKEGDEYQKRWLIGRIVDHASFKDVFNFLTIKDILQIWPKLRIRSEIKNAWEKAFKAWGYYVKS